VLLLGAFPLLIDKDGTRSSAKQNSSAAGKKERALEVQRHPDHVMTEHAPLLEKDGERSISFSVPLLKTNFKKTKGVTKTGALSPREGVGAIKALCCWTGIQGAESASKPAVTPQTF